MSVEIRPCFTGHALSVLLGLFSACTAQAALETAGELLVNLDASGLSEGALTNLSVGREFSQAEPTNCPTVLTLPDGVKAVVFDGGDWMMSPGTGTAALTNQAFTVEAWVKNSVNDGQESLFAWDAPTNGTDTGDAFVLNTSGQVCLHGSGLSLSLHQNVLPVSNQWHYVAVTYSGGDSSFWESGIEMVYVDGALNAWAPASTSSQTGLWSVWLSGGTNVLGARLSSSGLPTMLFSGALARLRFHSGALTPKQVRANYEAECGAFPALATNAPSALVTANALVLDVDASTLGTGAVSSWTGIRTLTQGLSGNQPAVQTVRGIKAVFFDGNDWLSASNVDARITGTSCVFTTEAWILNPSIGDDEPYFTWAQRGGPNLTYGAVCYASSPGYGAASHWGPVGDMGFDGGLPISNCWHHLVVTYDAAEGVERVYADGKLTATESKALALYTNGIYQVGRASALDGSDARYFSGAVARLRVHAGALTADQVMANYRYFRSQYGLSDPLLLASGNYFGGTASYADWGPDSFDGVVQVGETAVMSLNSTSTVARVGITGSAALSVANQASFSVIGPILVGAGEGTSGAPTGSLSVAGSLLSTYSSRYGLAVGVSGNGSLEVQPGGVISMPNGAEFWVGQGNGGVGRLTVKPGGRVTTTSWLLVGRSFGAGEALLDGGTMSCGTASLGEMSSNAVLRLKNGASFTAGSIQVGRRSGGTASLVADGSAVNVTGSLLSGTEGGNYNLVMLTNRTALVKRGTSFSMTQDGRGDFVVSGCSTVDVRDASSVVTFAANAGSIARVRIEKGSVFQLPATNSVLQVGLAGEATVDVTEGSRLQAAGIELPGASSTPAVASLLRVGDSTLALGAGGVRSASAYVPSGLILSNATLRADTNTVVCLPASVKGNGSVVDTAGYALTAAWPLSGGGFTKQGTGTLNLLPKNALTGAVVVAQGNVKVAPMPYVWCADDLTAYTNGQAVTSWQERNYRVAASSVTAGTGPAMVTNAFNGKRALRFNPAQSTLLQIASSDNPAAGAESLTIAVVFKPYAAGYASGLGAWWNSSQFIGGEVSGSANDWGFVFSQDSRIGMGLCQMSTVGNIDLMQYHATTATLSQPHVAICAWRPGAFALNLDGDETLNSAVYTAGSGGPMRLENIAQPRVPAPIYLGAGKATQSLALNGEIAEVRIFKNHFMDAYARQALVRELGETYGVSAAAGATMPSRPPYVGQLSQQTFAVTSVPPAAAVWSAGTLALSEGAAVSSWAATSGASIATAVTVDGQTNSTPSFAATAMGGLPAVRFYGRPLQLAAADDPLVGKGEFTAACVFQTTGSGTNAASWWSGSGLLGWKDSLTNHASDWGVAFTGNRIVAGGGACVVSGSEYAGPYRGNYQFNYTRASYAKSMPYLADGCPHVVVYRWSNNGLHAVSVDGQTTYLDSLSTYRMASLPLLLGGTRPEQAGFQGYVAEVRVYTNALTDSQEATVGCELAKRYGVVANAFAQPERLPGSRIVLSGSSLSISSNAVSASLATVQPGQTVAVEGSATVCGVLCIAGQASLTLSSATDSLAVGDLALQAGATLAWKHAGRTSTPIHVSGDVGLPSNFTLDLTGSSGIPYAKMTLIEYGGSATVPAGGVTATVIGAYKAGTKVIVVPAEKRVVVLTPAGTVVIVR